MQISFFICKRSLKQGMVCVYSIKNERVMVILEEKTENAKNPISQKSMDLGIILVSVNPTS